VSFVLFGVVASFIIARAFSGWPLRFAAPEALARMNADEYGRWLPHYRWQAGVCSVLNAVYYSALIWAAVAAAVIVRRALARRQATSGQGGSAGRCESNQAP
jgi:hypothetical protein